jgi:hypothetical protein
VVEQATVAGESVQLPVTPPLPPERATAKAAGTAPHATAARRPSEHAAAGQSNRRGRLHPNVPREPGTAEPAQVRPDHRRLRRSAEAEPPRYVRPIGPGAPWSWSFWR